MSIKTKNCVFLVIFLFCRYQKWSTCHSNSTWPSRESTTPTPERLLSNWSTWCWLFYRSYCCWLRQLQALSCRSWRPGKIYKVYFLTHIPNNIYLCPNSEFAYWQPSSSLSSASLWYGSGLTFVTSVCTWCAISKIRWSSSKFDVVLS